MDKESIAIAISDPISPRFMCVFIKGFLMKRFVAPTNCMVLMVILFEYIESLIEPFIIIIDIIKKNEAKTKTQNLILSKLSLIKETRGASYDI